MLPDTRSCSLGKVVAKASDPMGNNDVKAGKTKSLSLGQVAGVDPEIFFLILQMERESGCGGGHAFNASSQEAEADGS